MTDHAELIERLTRENADLRAEVVRLRGAVKPFFGDPVMEGLLWSDATPDSLVTIRIQKRIYDGARAALSPQRHDSPTAGSGRDG